MKISKSPERFTFQKQSYIERCKKDGKEISEAYLNMFDSDKIQHENKFEDPESRVNNLEYDLLTTEWILCKARESESYAQNLYAALCNNDFVKNDVWPILKEQKWSCSWRYAGGIIADMREEGDYIDWYCSGIGDGLGNGDSNGSKGYVSESVVTEEVRKDLLALGWLVSEDNDT